MRLTPEILKKIQMRKDKFNQKELLKKGKKDKLFRELRKRYRDGKIDGLSIPVYIKQLEEEMKEESQSLTKKNKNF